MYRPLYCFCKLHFHSLSNLLLFLSGIFPIFFSGVFPVDAGYIQFLYYALKKILPVYYLSFNFLNHSFTNKKCEVFNQAQ